MFGDLVGGFAPCETVFGVPGGAFCALKTATRGAKHGANAVETANRAATVTLNAVETVNGETTVTLNAVETMFRGGCVTLNVVDTHFAPPLAPSTPLRLALETPVAVISSSSAICESFAAIWVTADCRFHCNFAA